jgi:hypothetical protein
MAAFYGRATVVQQELCPQEAVRRPPGGVFNPALTSVFFLVVLRRSARHAGGMGSMDRYQHVAFWAAVAVCVLGFMAAAAVWIANFRETWQIELLRNHYAAIVGLPAAAAGSFVLITLFRQVSGELTIDLWGLKLQGAACPLSVLGRMFLGDGLGH